MKNVVWVLPDAGWRMFFLGGYRFFWLSDDLDMTSTIQPVGGPFGADRGSKCSTRSIPRTSFTAAKSACKPSWRRVPGPIGIITKVALGNNPSETPDRRRNAWRSVDCPRISPGGLFAQPTNIGRSSDDVFAVLPEASVTFGYQVTRCMRLTAGYNFLYMNHVLAPPSRSTARSTPRSSTMACWLATPAAHDILESEFWMHGFSTGMEVKW